MYAITERLSPELCPKMIYVQRTGSGCLVVGSDTAPVREVIENGINGIMVDFFDVSNLALALKEALDFNECHFSKREKAISVSSHFSREKGVGQYLNILKSLQATAGFQS